MKKYMKPNRKMCFDAAKRVVVKVGSGVLTGDRALNLDVIGSISCQMSSLIDKGLEVILVSSGAMAAGLKKLGLGKRPDDVPGRQAIAAVGQAGLILEYEKSFGLYGKKVAQILLTAEDLSNRERYLNARNTLNTLLSWNVVPIINENDTVVIDEIKVGDNDNLSAMISLLLDADILINLTDIDGLFTKNPKTEKDASLISVVSEIDENIEKIASGLPGVLGTGGMSSKIVAAKKTMASGVPMVIANGARENVLIDLFRGKDLGTYFVPKNGKLASRKCWIAFNLKPKGAITIDDGAVNAIVKRGKSLLPSGISIVEGDFGIGEPVAFKDLKGNNLGIGLVNYNSLDINRIKGFKSGQIEACLGQKPYDEVIHRDNLVVTCEN